MITTEDYIHNKTMVGFEDDAIFLLSIDEYKKYNNHIPHYDDWWWLRSPGNKQLSASCVNRDGSIDYNGYVVYRAINAVRPALILDNDESSNLKIGDRIVKHSFPWIYLGDALAIAEVPLAVHRFDKASDNYANSELRMFIISWLNCRR